MQHAEQLITLLYTCRQAVKTAGNSFRHDRETLPCICLGSRAHENEHAVMQRILGFHQASMMAASIPSKGNPILCVASETTLQRVIVQTIAVWQGCLAVVKGKSLNGK